MSYFFISSVKSEVLISCPFTTTEVIKRKNVSICFICSLVVLSMHANVLQLPEGGDFEALHCQPSTNYDGSTKLELPTEPPLLGRCCYRLPIFCQLISPYQFTLFVTIVVSFAFLLIKIFFSLVRKLVCSGSWKLIVAENAIAGSSL